MQAIILAAGMGKRMQSALPKVLHPLAVGWDWIGINLFDGSALTAFQLRDQSGKAMWDGGSYKYRLKTTSYEIKDAVLGIIGVFYLYSGIKWFTG
mgnify:CR=1 FL=1